MDDSITTRPTASLAARSKELETKLLSTITSYAAEGKLVVPQNYSPENAIKSAFLIMSQTKTRGQQPVLQACTPASISQAVLDMVLQGLSPAKKQCYFIATGNELKLFRSYLGSLVTAKRACPDVAKIDVLLFHEGDTVDIFFDAGQHALMLDTETYKTSLANQDAEITGGWGYAVDRQGLVLHSVVMTRKEIETAWDQSTNRGWRTNPGDPHRRYPQEMSKKTILGRLCKIMAGTSDDSSLFSEAYQRTTENEWRDVSDQPSAPKRTQGRGMAGLKATLMGTDQPATEQDFASAVAEKPVPPEESAAEPAAAEEQKPGDGDVDAADLVDDPDVAAWGPDRE